MFAMEVLGGSSSNNNSMRRTMSQPYSMHLLGGEEYAQHMKTTDRHIRALQRDLAIINDRLSLFEDVNARWGLRYTRRMAIVGNAFMGTWIFLYRLSVFLQQRRSLLIQAIIPKIQMTRKNSNSQGGKVIGSMLYHAVWHSIRGSWVFFLAVALLTRNRSWNQFAGASLGTLYAAFLSMVAGVSTRWPWVTTLAIAGNLSYLGTSMHVTGRLLPSFDEAEPPNPQHEHEWDDFDAIQDEGL